MFLVEQAQELATQIEELELEVAVEKEEFDAKQKSKKDALAVYKRVLKTTESALAALGNEDE